jgi:hypothetical protein
MSWTYRRTLDQKPIPQKEALEEFRQSVAREVERLELKHS